VKDSALYVRCTEAEKDRWRSFAEDKGQPLSVYVRALLNALVDGKERDGGSNGNQV
jgi:hypothetical protein